MLIFVSVDKDAGLLPTIIEKNCCVGRHKKWPCLHVDFNLSGALLLCEVKWNIVFLIQGWKLAVAMVANATIKCLFATKIRSLVADICYHEIKQAYIHSWMQSFAS